jgi:hypothetical protein
MWHPQLTVCLFCRTFSVSLISLVLFLCFFFCRHLVAFSLIFSACFPSNCLFSRYLLPFCFLCCLLSVAVPFVSLFHICFFPPSIKTWHRFKLRDSSRTFCWSVFGSKVQLSVLIRGGGVLFRRCLASSRRTPLLVKQKLLIQQRQWNTEKELQSKSFYLKVMWHMMWFILTALAPFHDVSMEARRGPVRGSHCNTKAHSCAGRSQ